jgi:predicted secreted Zn-dependent protease
LCAVSLVVLAPGSPWEGVQAEPLPTDSAALAARGAGPGGPAEGAPASQAVLATPPEAPEQEAPAVPQPGVRVATSNTYYAVDGGDLRSLLASLRQHGPSDSTGTWAASTAWVFRWSYRPVSDPDCHVGSAQVDLQLNGTYPQWSATPAAAPGVVTAWQAYMERVEFHERGHRDIAQATANELARMLEALPAHRSCSDLAAAAKSTAADLLARHAEAQAAYDRETAHGALQGAVLSPGT